LTIFLGWVLLTLIAITTIFLALPLWNKEGTIVILITEPTQKESPRGVAQLAPLAVLQVLVVVLDLQSLIS
jgi:hypothetical protein